MIFLTEERPGGSGVVVEGKTVGESTIFAAVIVVDDVIVEGGGGGWRWKGDGRESGGRKGCVIESMAAKRRTGRRVKCILLRLKEIDDEGNALCVSAAEFRCLLLLRSVEKWVRERIVG